MKRILGIFHKCVRAMIYLLFLPVVPTTVWAQTDLPHIIKPSPEASALFRFQDYPMDYSTGLPQISIPLYEVTSGSLSVPISLSYHASGRKVYDQDGPVALGWSLNAGGMISRTIYGAADFGTPTTGTYKFPYPFTVDNLSNFNDLVYLQKGIHYDGNVSIPEAISYSAVNVQPWLDTEYDIFSYSCGNNSGKFFFKDVNNVKTPVLLPYKPLVVTPTYTVNGLSVITITDEKGVTYVYRTGETYGYSSQTATSGWTLATIISADKTDTISFTYTVTSKARTTISQQAVLIDRWTANGEQFPVNNLTYPEITDHDQYQISRLSQITFKQGKVIFNLVTGNDKINSIQVLNLQNQVLKTIQFNRTQCYSQAELSTTTNKLDAIVFKDKVGAAAQTYSFEYYPLVSSNTELNVRYCDWWGYYNNSGQHDMVPRYTKLQYIGSGGPGTIDVGNQSAYREPSLEPMKSGVLRKIIYPTGGSTEFMYELNKCTLYGSSSSSRSGPGLRIYQIKAYDLNVPATIKTYKYGANESGTGAIELLPDLSTMASEIKYGYISLPHFAPFNNGKAYRQRTFYSGFINELSVMADRPVIYQEVAEYNGTETSNIGKSIYKYDFSPWAESAMPVMTPTIIYKKHVFNFNYWNEPSLIIKSDYKRVNTIYKLVKEAAYNYSLVTSETVKGLHIQRVYALPQAGRDGSPTSMYSEDFVLHNGAGNPCDELPAQVYTFSSYQIPVGYKNLKFQTETIYDDNGTSITSGTDYEYNVKQLVSKTTFNSSENTPLITVIKYPFDYTDNSQLTQMVTLNMLNYPVEQIETKNAIPTKSVRTNYLNYGTTTPRIYPQTIDVKKGDYLYETRLRYLGYDADGNPISVSKEHDIPTSYLWGYNNSYPVAEAKNAKSNELFFNSFEEGTGWDAALTAYDNTKSHCGRYSGRIDKPTTGTLYSHASRWLTLALTAPTKYRYSGWIYSNGPSAELYFFMKRAGETGYYTYIDAVANFQINKWVFIEKEFLVPADVTQLSLRIDNNGGGTVWFDDIKVSPSGAFMTTYTYDQLIGMTSSTDPNNLSSFYEYDLFGRLKLIRDINGNIIKTFNYQYQSATP